MLSTRRSKRLCLTTSTIIVAASVLVIACGSDEVGPADEGSSEASGGSRTTASTGAPKSSGSVNTTPGVGTGGNPATGTVPSANNAQGATPAINTGIPNPSRGGSPAGATTANPSSGQGGWFPLGQNTGKWGNAGAFSRGGSSGALGGSVAGGPTCKNNVRDGDDCNPNYDLAECVVRSVRVCECDRKESRWDCRASSDNAGGASAVGGQGTAEGGKSATSTGGKHGGSDPVAGQSSANLAGSGGK